MDDIYKLSLLFDFYGELLTPKQKSILDDYINSDLTISEIANNKQISRQGVHESIKRSEQIFIEFEEKLGLVQKFSLAKENITKVAKLLEEDDLNQNREQLKKLINKVFNSF